MLGEDEPPPRLPAWVRRAVVGVVLAALVVVLAPRLLSSGDGRTDVSPRPTPTRTSSSPSTPQPTITPTLPADLRWAPRGDLVGDRPFLEQIRTRLTGTALASVEEVLWAGTVRGGRAVLVAGFTLGLSDQSVPVVGVMLPTGSDVMTGGNVTHISDLSSGIDTVTAWVLPGSRQVLLLGGPSALAAEISPNVTFTPDGRVHRAWQRVGSADGWALVDLPALPRLAIAVRTDLAAFEVVGNDERSVDPVDVEGLDARGYAGPAAQHVRDEVTSVSGQDPLYGWRLRARVSWSGVIVSGVGARAVVVVITRSDGATFQVGLIESDLVGLSDFGLRSVAWDEPAKLPYLFGPLGSELGLEAQQVFVDPGGRGTVSFSGALGTSTTPIDTHGVAVIPPGGSDEAATSIVVRDRYGTRRFTLDQLSGSDAAGVNVDQRFAFR